MRRNPWLTALMVLLALPGIGTGLLLGHLVHTPPGPRLLLLWRVVSALPAVLAPAVLAVLHLQPNQRRAAIGLGAGPRDRLRYLWLPQAGPGLLASLLLALLLGCVLWLSD